MFNLSDLNRVGHRVCILLRKVVTVVVINLIPLAIYCSVGTEDELCVDFVPVDIFFATFEATGGDNNWTLLGGASDGNWVRNVPTPYSTGGTQVEIAAYQGSRSLFTRRGVNRDVDGGPTVARSRNITLPSTGKLELDLYYYFAHHNSAPNDYLTMELKRASDNQVIAVLINEVGSTTNRPAQWINYIADLCPYRGETVYMEIRAADLSPDSQVEAAFDNVRITQDLEPITSGYVYNDLNVNGIRNVGEPGLSGVIVSAYDTSGNFISQTTTNFSGYYQFTNLAACQQYTLLITNLPTDYQESVIGPDNKGIVIHISSGGENNFGLYNPLIYCEEDPFIIVPVYYEGPINGAYANKEAIMKVRSSADGHHFNGFNPLPAFQGIQIASYANVGTTNGMAYQKTKNRYYAAAYHKRYSAFGPQGPDAIYQLSPDGGVTGVLKLDILTGISNVAGTDVHDFTPILGEVYDLGLLNASFAAPGKRSFGDIEISGDQNTLYVVNLFNRRIYAINVSSGNTATSSLITSWATPDPTGAGRHRPFGLAWHNNLLWVGTVDENANTAWVHSLNPQTGVFTLRLTVPLNFNRQSFFGNANNTVTAPARWRAWVDNPNFTPFATQGEIGYPQPMLSDIEFAADGAMILGFRDRFGDQSGANKRFNLSSLSATYSITSGDILKACFINGNYTLETGLAGACPTTGGLANSGPSNYEFYYWDIYALPFNTWNPNVNTGGFHWENTQGGLLQLRNAPYVLTTAMSPISDFSGGVMKLNNSTGVRQGIPPQPVNLGNLTGGYTLFEGGDYGPGFPPINGTAGNANGLGDIEAVCKMPIMIGNYVWYDVNKDGLQGANEPPLVGVTVQLYNSASVLIGEAVTDADGYYYFGGTANANMLSGFEIEGDADYTLSISFAETMATPYNLAAITITDASSNTIDHLDSDAMLSSNALAAIINISTGNYGITNYTYDFGFIDCVLSNVDFVFESCEDSGYTLMVGDSLFNESNTTGTVILTNIEGCDSIVNVQLFFYPNFNSTISYSGCSGDGYSLIVNGTTYNETNPIDTIILSTVHNCDSIIYVNLFFEQAPVVEAGMLADPLCSNTVLMLSDLNASITGGTSTGKWTSTGDGVFNNMGNYGGANPATTYSPGPSDISSGEVTLNLTSVSLGSYCNPVADAVLIFINDVTCSQFPWSGN